MNRSVSATELAKLGKCAALIQTSPKWLLTVAVADSHEESSPAILRGLEAHERYDQAAREHMSYEALQQRQSARTAVNVAIAFAAFLLLALLIR